MSHPDTLVQRSVRLARGLLGTLVCTFGLMLGMSQQVATAGELAGRVASGLNTLSAPSAARTQLLDDWKLLIKQASRLDEASKLEAVHRFFNQNIRFDEDINIWGTNDYWATPLETLTQGRGDCEDFAIAKYFTLLEMGVNPEKLRLVYTKARLDTPSGTQFRAHMVLAYYPSASHSPMILDNMNTRISDARQRDDLEPVFSFNLKGIWQGTGLTASRSTLGRWDTLIGRIRAEGLTVASLNGRTARQA